MKLNAVFLVICTSLGAACVPNSQLAERSVTTPVNIQRVGFTNETKVTLHSEIKLARDVQAEFNEFRETGGVYGAMFVTEDGRAFSWRSRRFSVEDAMAAAQVDCEAFFRRACVLYATLGPAAEPDGEVLIPDQSRDNWQKAIRETQPGNYIAIATNKAGMSGFAWDFGNASEARTAAIETCERETTAKSEESIVRVVSANETAGIYECRIFGTFR
jgi:hypothetical protein